MANDPLYHPVFSADFKKKVLVDKSQTEECSAVTQSADSGLPSNPFGYESDDSSEDLQEDGPTRTRQSHKDEDKQTVPQVVLPADQKGEEVEEEAHGRDRVSSVSSRARKAESSPPASIKLDEKDGFLAFDPQDPIVPFFSLSRPASRPTVETTEEEEHCRSSLRGPVQRILEGGQEKEGDTWRDEDETRKCKREDNLLVMMQGGEEKNRGVTEGSVAPGACQSAAVRCAPCQLSFDRIRDILGQADPCHVTERSPESPEGGRHDGDDESLPVSGEAGRETRELPVLLPGGKDLFGTSCRSLGLQSFRLIMKDPLRPHTSEELIFELDVPPEWGGGIRDALQEDEMEAWRESGETMIQEAKQKQQLERQQANVIEDGVDSRAVRKNVILGHGGYWHMPQSVLAN